MEIDETVIVRRKYERSRVASKAQVWLFGGVERNTNGEQCFLAVIDGQHSAQNLTNDKNTFVPGPSFIPIFGALIILYLISHKAIPISL